jgi:hypothetical protein
MSVCVGPWTRCGPGRPFLGDAAGTVFLSGAPQIPLGDVLGDAAGDALGVVSYKFSSKVSMHAYSPWDFTLGPKVQF